MPPAGISAIWPPLVNASSNPRDGYGSSMQGKTRGSRCPAPQVSGVHQLFRGITADSGATWTMTQLTFGGEKKFRPVKLAGTSLLSYVIGDYTTYTSFNPRIQKLAV